MNKLLLTAAAVCNILSIALYLWLDLGLVWLFWWEVGVFVANTPFLFLNTWLRTKPAWCLGLALLLLVGNTASAVVMSILVCRVSMAGGSIFNIAVVMIPVLAHVLVVLVICRVIWVLRTQFHLDTFGLISGLLSLLLVTGLLFEGILNLEFLEAYVWVMVPIGIHVYAVLVVPTLAIRELRLCCGVFLIATTGYVWWHVFVQTLVYVWVPHWQDVSLGLKGLYLLGTVVGMVNVCYWVYQAYRECRYFRELDAL